MSRNRIGVWCGLPNGYSAQEKAAKKIAEDLILTLMRGSAKGRTVVIVGNDGTKIRVTVSKKVARPSVSAVVQRFSKGTR